MKVIILHRNSFDVIGGVESTIYYMAKELNNLGFEAIVVAKKRSDSVQQDNNNFCKVIRYKPSRYLKKATVLFHPYLEYKNAFKDLKNIILHEKPDFIISRDNLLSYAISHYYNSNKIVYIPLGVIKYYNLKRKETENIKSFILELIRYIQLKQESFFQLKALKKLKHIVVFSNNMKNQIYHAIGDTTKVSVVYPGVAEKFIPMNTEKTTIRDEFSIPTNKKIFLFVGRVVREKNIRMLIEAFKKSNYKDSYLIIVGGGDDLEYVKNMVEKLQLTKNVFFTGFRKDTELFYREASFFVLPSYYESFGNVILEAMASGTPVIGFKTEEGKTLTAVGELIENEKNGFVCENYSLNSLVRALNKAHTIYGTAEYKKMRKYCAESTRLNFSWNKFLKRILNVLQNEV